MIRISFTERMQAGKDAAAEIAYKRGVGAAGGKRYSRASKLSDYAPTPAGTWDRLTAETWSGWRGACDLALATFRAAVIPSPVILAPGETVKEWESFR